MSIYKCIDCDYNTQLKFNLDKHFLTNKHLVKMSLNKKSPDTTHKKYEVYECKKCQYITNNKRYYKNHILTTKHLSEQKSPKIPNEKYEKYEKYEEKLDVSYNCEKCNYLTKNKKDYTKHLDTRKHISKNSTISVTNDMLLNKPITELLIEIIKNQTIIQNKMFEQTNTMTYSNNNNTTNNNNNNTTTTNNQNFNLQFFLNETCKDAMNIDEFINSLKVTMEDFENTGKIGYVEGITRIIINGLNQVDTTKRPIHCTDVKRETVYIKSEDSWEKENPDKEKLKKAVKQVARMNLSQLPTWQRENPASEVLDTREHCQYVKYSLAALGGVGDIAEEQNIDKIMRNVIKETIVDKK